MNMHHSTPQALAAPVTEDHCCISIYPDTDLLFNVMVLHMGKRYVRGGFANPDEAQKRGVEILLAMHHAYSRRGRAHALNH